MKRLLHLYILLLALLSATKSHAQVLNVCEGDSLKLSTAILNIPTATSVEWFRNNVLISTDTAFVITQPGVYTLRCSGTGACHSDFSQPLTVVVDSLKAVNDSAYTLPGTTVAIKVLLNDQAACYPVDTPSLIITKQGNHGEATYVGNGVFSYTPVSGFSGIDTFYYVVHDVNGNPSNVAMVIVSISSSNVLPIVLGDFEAVKVEDESHLYWTTYSTANASHFEIERSPDAKTFEFKGKVTAPTNSNSVTNYNYWDKTPLNGKNYYRLKLVDVDGKSTYSEIRLVNFDNTVPIKIYPIPAQDYVTVDLGGNDPSGYNSVVLLDVAGKQVLKQTITAAKTTIDLNEVTVGTYYIRLIDMNNNITDMTYKINKVK
jgi:hypothetical protein